MIPKHLIHVIDPLGVQFQDNMADQIQSTSLDNGLKILTEHMPGLRSVSVGVWARRGSRHETPELNGICHFIEHTVFKGTERRSALDIAIESDRLGGHFDAFTTHEVTGFTMKITDKALPQAFDLMADMLSHPRFDRDDLQLVANKAVSFRLYSSLTRTDTTIG